MSPDHFLNRTGLVHPVSLARLFKMDIDEALQLLAKHLPDKSMDTFIMLLRMRIPMDFITCMKVWTPKTLEEWHQVCKHLEKRHMIPELPQEVRDPEDTCLLSRWQHQIRERAAPPVKSR